MYPPDDVTGRLGKAAAAEEVTGRFGKAAAEEEGTGMFWNWVLRLGQPPWLWLWP
jgi:hypothetical protein